jgi:hypothetical protein
MSNASKELLAFTAYTTVAFLSSVVLLGASVGAYKILTEWLNMTAFQAVMTGSFITTSILIARYEMTRNSVEDELNK